MRVMDKGLEIRALIELETLDRVLGLLTFVRDQEDEGLEALRQKLVAWREAIMAVKH